MIDLTKDFTGQLDTTANFERDYQHMSTGELETLATFGPDAGIAAELLVRDTADAAMHTHRVQVMR